jgi:glycosyltransferase involved in cell wall biosynthesis
VTSTRTAPRVSVVIPVFNEEQVLPELHDRIVSTLSQVDGGFEVIYVDDGSTDSSAELIEARVTSSQNVTLVQLSRNFGMDIAMSAGLMALIFFTLMKYLARVPFEGQAGDFRLMSRRVVESVKQMPERRRFIRGMVSWVGFKQEPIEYRRAGRAGGRGASYPQLFRLAAEAVTSFSDVPLNLATYLGLFTAGLSGIAAAAIFILTILQVMQTGTETWILVSVLFLGGVQLISVGILGQYLARVHEESLKRPLYLIKRVVGGASR